MYLVEYLMYLVEFMYLVEYLMYLVEFMYACKVRGSVGDSGLCCCACVTTFKR